MRHKVYGKHLGRDKNQRTALFRSLIRGIILHESIQTTEAKAKAIKGLVDKLISQSKKNTAGSLRSVQSFVNQPDIFKKLVEEVAPRYTDRVSGFTRIIKLGNRQGDGAMMVQMSLIKTEPVADKKTEATKASKETKKSTKSVSGKKEEAVAAVA